jgi:hypothetical protein
MKDPYEILGLSSHATAAEIKRAYRELAKTFHPDVSSSADASRRMQEINSAYGLIGDPIKRAEYDQMQQMRAAQTPEQQRTSNVHVTCARCGKVDASLRVSTFTTVWSFLVMSFYRGWSYILCARCRTITSLRYNLQVLIFGWWGIPFGIYWTLKFLIQNGIGGHQPTDNNAALLAIVGQNLINLGDYAEAEKALISSLHLKEDPAVAILLQIAKKQSGYSRPPSITKRLSRLEAHPVFYNLTLVVLFFAGITCLGIFSKPAVSGAGPKQALGSNSLATTASWWNSLQAQINLLRGRRWQIPIHLGDTYEDVVAKLGEPSENWLRHFEATPGDETLVAQYKETNTNQCDWSDKGIHANFKDGKVDSLVMGAKHYYYDFNGALPYGLGHDDKLDDFLRKLGKPQKISPGDGHDVPQTIDYTWWTPAYEIQVTFANTPFEDGKKGLVAPGETYGGIFIADVKPSRDAAEQLNNERAEVAVSGKILTAKEIFDKYQERVVVVTCLNTRGVPYALGTGFIYRGNQVLTNYHVVKDARTITISNKFHETAVEVTPRWASKNADFVMLQPDIGKVGWNKDDLPPVTTQTDIDPGEPVTVIGTPEGLPLSISTGIFSAQREDNGLNWLQITAAISHGSSGSPVFDSKGELIGLATLMLSDAQGLNFATSISTLIKVEAAEEKKDNSADLREALKIPANSKTITWNPFGLGVLHQADEVVIARQQAENDLKNQDPLWLSKHEWSDDYLLKSSESDIAIDTRALGEYPDPQDQYDLLSDIASDYEEEAATYESEGNVNGAYANKQAEMRILSKVVDVCEPEAKFDDFFQLALLEEQEHPELVSGHLNKAVNFSEKRVADELVQFQHLNPNEASGNSYQTPARQQVAAQLTTDCINVGKGELALHDPEEARSWLGKAATWIKLSAWLPPDHSQGEIDRLLKLRDKPQSTTQAPIPPAPSDYTTDPTPPAPVQ